MDAGPPPRGSPDGSPKEPGGAQSRRASTYPEDAKRDDSKASENPLDKANRLLAQAETAAQARREGEPSPRAERPAADNVEFLPLWRFFQDDQWKAAEEFIKDPSVDVNIRDDIFGWTPLHFAANGGALDLYKSLVGAKAKVDMTCREGNTALMMACRRGHARMVEYMIAKKANLDAQNKLGWTPIIWSSINGHEEVTTMLIQAHASYLHADGEGRTPCMWAARHGHLVLVENFLACGLNLSVTDKAGLTVFDHAGEHLEMRITISAVEEVNTHLLDAARQNDKEAVVRALEAGADLEVRDDGGFTALMWAALNNSVDMVELVIRHGANPSLQVFYGPEAIDSQHMEVGEAIEEIIGSNDRLLAAAMDNDFDAVFVEIEIGAFINVQDHKDRSALMWAARHGQKDVVERLVTKNSLIDDRDKSGWAAIHFAVAAKSAGTVSMLHHLGADFAPRTYEGDTLLHMSVRANDGAMIQLLLAAKSSIEERDIDEQTPLMLACINGLSEAIGTLLCYGAEITVADEHGRGPCSLAVVSHQQDAIRALMDHPKPPPLLPGEVGEDGAKPEKKGDKHKKADEKPASKAKAKSKSEAKAKAKAEAKADTTGPTAGVATKKKILQREGKEKRGESPEHLINMATGRKSDIVRKNKDSVAKALLAQPDEEGYTPLALAVRDHHDVIVMQLLGAKADLNATSNNGNNVFFEAVIIKHVWLCDRLLELGAKFEHKNKAGLRPLDICEDETLRLMLERQLVLSKVPKSSKAPTGEAGEAKEEGEPKKKKEKTAKIKADLPTFRIRFESLPPKMTQAELVKAVGQKVIKLDCGKPEAITVPLDPITYVPLGHAFVDFSTAAQQDLAVRGDGDDMFGYQVRIFKEIPLRLSPMPAQACN